MASKVLLASTCRWFSTARLAAAFGRAGCEVEVVCPPRHCVQSTRSVQKTYLFNGLAPVRSVRQAILSSGADFVIPCDDLMMKHLHRVYEDAVRTGGESGNRLRQLLRFSLGDPAGYAITESRDNFMATINKMGIRAPETKMISSSEELNEWISRFGFPAVLKADGTSGGEGVKIVHSRTEAERVFRMLSAPLSTAVAAKRVAMDRDLNCVLPWLEQRKRVVSIQSFVTGPDANMAVACCEGRILSSISVEVLKTWKPKGPATLVRLIENLEMYEAVEKILADLKFTGLCGFDFLIDKQSGEACLIEMNARATQTCPLPLGPGRDPIAAICSLLTGQLVYSKPLAMHGETIALFPLAWQGDTSEELFQTAYHDIPWDEPELVRIGMRQVRRQPRDRWIRMALKLRQRWA